MRVGLREAARRGKHERDQAGRPRLARGVTRRSLVIGFALVPVNVFFLVRCIHSWAYGAIGPFFSNTVAALFCLVALNQWLKRKRPSWALRPGEMLIVYAMLTVSNGLVGGVYSVGGLLPAVMTYPFWFATGANRWTELLWPHLPTWLTVRERAVLEGFWSGDASPYLREVVLAWAVPAFWWATFMGAVFWTCLCLNSIIRRRWDDEEKLPFPFVTLPVRLADERFGLLRSKTWWFGLGASAAVTAWNVFAGLVPSLPAIPLAYDFYAYFSNRWPWAIHMLNTFSAVTWSPLALGICYLMPQDLLFSLFTFGFILLTVEVVSYGLGWSTPGGFPYAGQQMSGSMVGLAVAFLWLDRHYLAQVARRALGLRSVLQDDREEPLGYRVAVLGAILGLGYCWWFWSRAQVPLWIVPVFICLYLVVAMITARVRAQVGSPVHELPGIPDSILRALAGTPALGPRSIGMFTLLTPYLLWDQENSPAPAQLEAMKMAEAGRMERRRLAVALAITVPVTVLCSFWAYVHFGYQFGVGTGRSHAALGQVTRTIIELMDSSLRVPAGPSTQASLALGFGAGLAPALLFLKLRFPWWPLHPLAFPICHTWYMHYFALAMVLMWLTKALLLRYGGLRAYQSALPLFLGFIVGDSVVTVLRQVSFLAFHIGV